MPIDTWFPLAVYYEDLEDAHRYKQAFIDAVLQLQRQGHTPRNYPEMAWTGDLHGVEQIHADPRFTWIVQQVETHTVIYLKELGLDLGQVDLFIQRAWPVVSRFEQEVGAHCHNTAHISAVYYVAVPETGSDAAGCLTFFNDTRQNEVSPGLGGENTDIIAAWNYLNQDSALYLPTEGRLIIFPAKQRHGVSLNHTEGLRISLSFDIVITAKPGASAGTYEFLAPPPSHWQRFGRPAV